MTPEQRLYWERRRTSEPDASLGDWAIAIGCALITVFCLIALA
jgi:hypothetical protein